MRRLSEISEALVPVADRWWGQLCWIEGGPLGFEVRHFRDPAHLQGYASLLEEAFAWGHADPFAWHVLIIDAPYEVGEDFVMIRRYPGVKIRHFYPEHTDDPVEPPTEKLAMLAEAIARMRVEAESPSDKLIAEMVANRVAALDHHLVFGLSSNDERFHLYDLDPDPDELAAWIAAPRNPDFVP